MGNNWQTCSIDNYQERVRTILTGFFKSGSFFGSKHQASFSQNHIRFPVLCKKKTQRIFWYNDFKLLIQDATDQGLIIDAIVLGSYGDFSHTNFSDIDVTILVPDHIFRKCNMLKKCTYWVKNKLNPFLLKRDPLQHHGAFFLWPELLGNYNENILPLSTYKDCWSINGFETNFIIDEFFDDNRSRLNFTRTILSLLNPENNFFRYGMNPYSIKRLLSNFMLIPAYFFQSQGIVINKKQSISEIFDIAPQSIRDAIILATDIRNEWPSSPFWLGKMRSRFIRGRGNIPGGRADMVLTMIYRKKRIEQRFKKDFLPLLKPACSSYLELNQL